MLKKIIITGLLLINGLVYTNYSLGQILAAGTPVTILFPDKTQIQTRKAQLITAVFHNYQTRVSSFDDKNFHVWAKRSKPVRRFWSFLDKK